MNETTVTDQDKISALRREAERIEEDATYSSKGHFNAEDTWVRRNYWLGAPATVLGAIAGATLIKSQPEWASAFTLLAALLTGLMTFLKPNDFNATLEAKNKENNSLIKPTIRLMKYWNATSRFPFESFTMEKWICGLNFWFKTNQKDYLFAVIDNIGTNSSYSQWVNNEITRAKNIVAKVKQYESDDMPVTAENEIKKLFRL